jgi:hypothetical protein
MTNKRSSARGIPISSPQYRRKCHIEIRCNRCHIRCADTITRDIHERFCDGKQPSQGQPQRPPKRVPKYWQTEIIGRIETGGI